MNALKSVLDKTKLQKPTYIHIIHKTPVMFMFLTERNKLRKYIFETEKNIQNENPQNTRVDACLEYIQK